MASFSFACAVCLEQQTQLNQPRTISGIRICQECIISHLLPLFRAALDHETRYPVTFGIIELPAAAFREELGEPSLRCYSQREIEYKTARADRVYCRHQILASAKLRKGETAKQQLALTPDQIEEAEDDELELVECGAMVSNNRSTGSAGTRALCYACRSRTCGKCEEPLHSISQAHTCTTSPHRPTTEPDDHSMVRGRDFQLCPNAKCAYPVALSEGCNHIICPISVCKTNFCFVCGKAAEDGSAHWTQGKSCPRYNQPGAQNALFDNVDGGWIPRPEGPAQGRGWIDMPARNEQQGQEEDDGESDSE